MILIQIWFRFTEIMSVLPVQTTGTRILNTTLLFLVALEPYLFNLLPFFGPSQASDLNGAVSTVYAIDIGVIYGILALFTHILAKEEKKLVTSDLLKKYTRNRDLEVLVAIIFFVSAIPQFSSLDLRYYLWATTFFIYRAGNLVTRLRKQSLTSES